MTKNYYVKERAYRINYTAVRITETVKKEDGTETWIWEKTPEYTETITQYASSKDDALFELEEDVYSFFRDQMVDTDDLVISFSTDVNWIERDYEKDILEEDDPSDRLYEEWRDRQLE